MTIIPVTASGSYDVIIGSGILPSLPVHLQNVTKAKKLCIVSDDTVAALYGKRLKGILEASGYACCEFTFLHGENSKNPHTYLQLLNFLAECKLTRSDALIALGGGVVGDLTGFAAATWLRGIDYVQIPTTLLAAVDSSVGGKTAIDLPAGKNLVGAFYQPKLVLCDTDLLRTLPETIFRDGCAEVIKYGVLYDEALFESLHQTGMDFDRERVIGRCVELKRDVVAQDEFDRGSRQKLNLGHTIGHGVEACSQFSVSHGQAVAIGMAIVSRAAAQWGLCSTETADRIHAILDRFSLPTGTVFSARQLYSAALSDKKRSGETVNLIVPQAIGSCCIYPISVENMESFIQAGL